MKRLDNKLNIGKTSTQIAKGLRSGIVVPKLESFADIKRGKFPRMFDRNKLVFG